MQEVKPSITDIYLIWGSGPGHSSPVRICSPSTVLLGILQRGKSKAGHVFIPRSRSARQTRTCGGKRQGSILSDLCLLWIKSPHLRPSHTLMCFPHPKTSSLPFLILLIQLHQVAHIRAYRTGKHCHGLSAGHSQGTNTRRKKHQFLENKDWNFSFAMWTSLVAHAIYKMKHKMSFSFDKHGCTCLLRSISGISTYSRQITALCRCVRDGSAEIHAWLKMYHAYGKQKCCICLSSQITEISLFRFTLT